MDEQLFGEGFRVTVNRCKHRVILRIDSVDSARISVISTGVLTFECSNIAEVFDAVIPTKLVAQMLGSIIGFSEPPDDSHDDGADLKREEMMLFPDELTLELWLRDEFFPKLDVFEDEDISDESIAQAVGDAVRQIMAEALGNKAKERIRRDWRA